MIFSPGIPSEDSVPQKTKIKRIDSHSPQQLLFLYLIKMLGKKYSPNGGQMVIYHGRIVECKKNALNKSKYIYIYLAKLLYFTNLDFPEIRGSPLRPICTPLVGAVMQQATVVSC